MAPWAGMTGRRWTCPRECATTRASRPNLPWGGCIEGPEVQLRGLAYFPLGSGHPTENWLVCHSVFGCGFRFIQV